ncbi:13762_t:CDS:2 [Ambispora leptoticha]|uniref:13762_t:CDS:1 n=1 Tax=Ambispora leptoticha TaxID=144679 RepID=A0A9N8VSR1_9GLOM|nr:13762_t:CDS:2 [Ambispora leptoticha]
MNKKEIMNEEKVSATFEFTIFTTTKEFWSPPFATSTNMYWQLNYEAENEAEPGHCALWLRAIPNYEESTSNTMWFERAKMKPLLYFKNALNPKSHVNIYETFIEPEEYSLFSGRLGYNFTRAYLPPKIILGVTFTELRSQSDRADFPFPPKHLSENAVNAWMHLLCDKEIADVVFNVKGKKIYANAIILSARSEYFRSLFSREWAESTTPKSPPSPDNKNNNLNTCDCVLKNQRKEICRENSKIKYVVEVTDFDSDVFMAMLRYLHTAGVVLNRYTDSTSWSCKIFAISDKYLISELRGMAKGQILYQLSIENAAEIFFEFAWKWHDLKEEVLKYVVEHFPRIRKTKGYKKICRPGHVDARIGSLSIEIMNALDFSSDGSSEDGSGSMC